MQKHNRQMSYSLYISALAGTDTVVLFMGKYEKPVTFKDITTPSVKPQRQGSVKLVPFRTL